MQEQSTISSMFRPAIAFSAWTVFSFLCHYGAKEFLHQPGERLLLTCLLTMAQLVSCYVFLSHGGGSGSKKGITEAAPRWAYGLAVLTHVAATFSTNYSLSLLYAPSTLTIKLLEPLMSALVVWLVLGKPVTSQTLMALLLLIAGALGFVGNPLASLSLGAGTVLALISNVLYGLRNILIKHFLNADMQLCDGAEYVVYAGVGVVAMWLCNQDAALLFMLLSGVCHVIYSYISTKIILHELSVVAHAVANISKRLLVVLLMVAAAQKHLEWHKYLWLGVCGIGLCMYSYNKLKAKSEGAVMVTESRQKAMMTSLTSMLLVLLLATCISLSRSPTDAQTPLRKTEAPQRVKRDVFQEPAHIHVARKLLAQEEEDEETKGAEDPKEAREEGSRWDSVCGEIVSRLQPLIGKKRNVILSHYPLDSERASAMENVGLLYILQELEAKIHHAKDRKPADVIAQVKDKQNGIFVIVAASANAGPALKEYLGNEQVDGVMVFLPSALGKHKDLYKDNTFLELLKDKAKLSLVCHDAETAKLLKEKGVASVSLSPVLTLCIPRVYRFLKPLYRYVAQASDGLNVCSHITGLSERVRCDSRSWALSAWATPKGIDEVEDVYIRTYIGYFFVLRGQVVIVDELAALLAAMQFDIPAVALTSVSPDMKAYLDTWHAHGYGNNMRIAQNIKHAATQAEELAAQKGNELVDYEPGVKIIRSLH